MPEVAVHKDGQTPAWQNDIGCAALGDAAVKPKSRPFRMERLAQEHLWSGVSRLPATQ